jgi:outer membrane protein assembly factor BamB
MKARGHCFILLGIALLACNCKKDDIVISIDNEVVYITPIWEYPLHTNGSYSNSIIKANLVFGPTILLGTTEGPDNRYLTAVDMRNAEFMWKWNDIYQAPTEYFDIQHFYRQGNLFIYQVGSRSYCIDLSDGSTYWKIRRDVSLDTEITGFGPTYFLSGRSVDTLEEYKVTVGYQGNIETGELEQFLIPFYDQGFIPQTLRLGDVTAMLPVEENNTKYLVVIYQQQVSDIAEFQSYMGLYNYDTKEWVYDSVVLNDPVWYGVLIWEPTLYNDKIYMNIGHDIVCHDYRTGEFIWKQEFTQDFLFSGITVQDGMVLGNCEDTYLYNMDPESGNIIWKEKTAGTSSSIRYLNGIVYLSGGSTGNIHAIDTQNGRTIWRLDAARYKDGSNDFKADLYTIAGTDGEPDRLIIFTYNTAYCIEAHQ